MESNVIYHVFNRANGNELFFKEDFDYGKFKYYLFKYLLLNEDFDLYAYCLLPNHFHLLISPRRTELEDNQRIHYNSLIFSNMFNAYAKYFNYKYDRKGSLFMRPFKRKALKSSLAFGKLIHYIHANPVHHGYCDGVDGWPYSSYLEYLGKTKLVNNKAYTMEWFGGKTEFEEYHSVLINRKVKGIYIE